MPDREHEPELTDGPPRAALIAAIGLAVAGVVGVLAFAALRDGGPADPGPVVIAAAPAPHADSPECRRLLQGLPDPLGDFARATAADPVPAGTAAWRKPGVEQPVVLRCGLDTPADFVVGAPLQEINGVQWFVAADAGRSTWFAVDRPTGVALTLPEGSGPTPIQHMSDVVKAAMPAVPPRPGPPR